MKKKILIFLALISIVACFFALAVSAGTPNMYIEFGARFPGSNEYITVYTENAESTGNPKIDFANKKFYSDVDFTQEVDMSTATGIDFSVAKTYASGVEGNAPTRMQKPSSPFVNCIEVKWFLAGMPTVSYNGGFFKGWTGLKHFDFGNATAVADNTFENCGFEELVIPSSITRLASRSFADNANLKSVKFEGATELSGNACAFQNCSALESVDLGSIPYVGKGTFKECTALKSVVIPSSVTEIRAEAFQNCTALNSVTYEGTPRVKEIGGGAFQNVPASNLTIPSSLEKISGQKAFAGSGIQVAVIPAGCTDLSTYTFNASKLTSVRFAEDFTGPFEFYTGVFQGCSQLTSVELPEGITVIGQDCFNGAPITTFVLPDSVKEIKNSAFANCKKLTTFTINPTSTLTKLGSQVFKDGIALTSFYFPNSLTSIGSGLFIYNNGSLKELINFENCGVTTIPDSVFSQCSGLKEVKFPYGVTEINGKDLLKWANLDSITLPQTLTTISNSITANSIGKIIFAAPDGTALPANAPSTTVEYANYCETYFASAHLETDDTSFSFVDADGNPIEGKNYLASINVYCECGRSCGSKSVLKTLDPMFVFDGFSTPTENGKKGLALGISVNEDSVDEYYALTNKTISFGAYIAGYDNVKNDNVTDMYNYEKAIKADVTIKGVSYYAMRITGFEKGGNDDTKLCLGAYVIENGVVSYLQAGTPEEGSSFSYTTYTDAYANSSIQG